jgi:hypothetical protein
MWLAGAAVLLTVLTLAGCVVATTSTAVKAAKHPAYTAGTACDASGCHDTYKHKTPYTGPCEKCHTLETWKPAVYSHIDTSFDNGMHPLIGCAMCHPEGEPLPSPLCSKCHDAPHGGATYCVKCHTTTAWGIRKSLPSWHVSLLGGHKNLECFDCHKDAPAPAQPRTCTNCHGTNHGGLTNCQDCHSPANGWQKPKAGWSHDTFFKIRGQHAKLDCTQCHVNGRFAGTPKVCVGCHGKQHGGLTDCASCHTFMASAGFKYTTFRHSSTGFPLTGMHTKVGCMGSNGVQCHYNAKFAQVRGGGSHQCVACHAANSPHGSSVTQCQDCHTPAGFGGATHPYTLVGVHATLACSRCHTRSDGSVPGTQCVSCHAAQSPHGAGITRCQDCHSNAAPAFAPITKFVHPASVPLSGAHADKTKCGRCHPALVFDAPRTPCTTSGCHATFHVGPTDCLSCHFTTVPFVHAPVMFGSSLAGLPDNPHRTATTFGTYPGGFFGTFPTGCMKCHPGPGGLPDFTQHSCTQTGCHAS